MLVTELSRFTCAPKLKLHTYVDIPSPCSQSLGEASDGTKSGYSDTCRLWSPGSSMGPQKEQAEFSNISVRGGARLESWHAPGVLKCSSDASGLAVQMMPLSLLRLLLRPLVLFWKF